MEDMKGRYFIVYDWMTQELGLHGNELLVYAYIFSFTRSVGAYAGTAESACAFFHFDAKTWRNVTASLERKGLIVKQQYKAERGNRFTFTAKEGKFTTYAENMPTAAILPETDDKEGIFSALRREIFPCKEGNFSPNNNLNNNLNSSQENAPAREDGWKDEARASRMAEALRNGGTLCDDMVRGLSFGGVRIQAEKIVALADQFVSLQRATGSDHTSDADFRSHFLRWATIQLKEEQAKRPRRSEPQPSEEEVRRRSEAVERWDENHRNAVSYADYLAMKSKGEI